MNQRYRRRTGSPVRHPLKVKLTELGAPQPVIAVPPPKTLSAKTSERHGHQGRATPSTIITRIAEDAVKGMLGDGQTSILSVAPCEVGDPTLLFLRRGGQTCLMLGVPSRVVRLPRLRGDPMQRNRDVEKQFKMLRVAESASLDGAAFGNDEDDER